MTTRDLEGKTIVVTGANTGIGRATAAALAVRGATLVLAGRSAEKTLPVIDELRTASGNAQITFSQLDLGDLADVRRSAESLAASHPCIDVLINNAGLAGTRGQTKDGFELAFGTNHLGPFLYTQILLPSLRRAPQGRIVNVASRAHLRAKGIPFERLRQPTWTVTGLEEYGISKLANVLHAAELARREAGQSAVTAYSLHPGVVASDVWRRVPWPFVNLMKMLMISNEEGALTSLHCATDPALATVSGRYYKESREARMNPLGKDEALAKTLWTRSEEWTS
jgi:NAD(P)-dependent dehydrogenase (short-subunit alcohol dehydrogenase family)